MRLRITTIIENNPANDALLCNEHGLSLYIETDGFNILFDTGQSGNFIENAEKLNVNLNTVDYVVLSHGHYDHTGGFTKLVKKVGSSFKLIVGDKFFAEDIIWMLMGIINISVIPLMKNIYMIIRSL